MFYLNDKMYQICLYFIEDPGFLCLLMKLTGSLVKKKNANWRIGIKLALSLLCMVAEKRIANVYIVNCIGFMTFQTFFDVMSF